MKKDNKIQNYRCPVCGKFLFKGKLNDAIIQIKCKNCKRLETIIEK
jgi:phage FluMu protein Com